MAMAEPLEEDEQLEFSAEFSYDGEVWQPSHRAATIIQAHWRGFVGRWAALHKRALYTAAAEVIQECWRRRKELLLARAKRDVGPVRRRPAVSSRDAAAITIQRHHRGCLARRLLVVARARALLLHSLGAPAGHGAMKSAAGACTQSFLATFTQRAPLGRKRAPVSGAPRLGASLCALREQKGEQAALDAAARDALYWSKWLLPEESLAAEADAFEASHAALCDVLSNAEPGPQSAVLATHLASRVACETAGAVSSKKAAEEAHTTARLVRDTGRGVRETGRPLPRLGGLPTKAERARLIANFQRVAEEDRALLTMRASVPPWKAASAPVAAALNLFSWRGSE